MPSSTPLFDLLGIHLPIVQAPMAGVSSPAMAAAATMAGALGSVSVGATDADGARTMIAAVRERCDGPLNVNVFCHRPPIANSDVESAWIERWRPEFEAFGATPPAQLTEIYRSFVADDAMLAMLLEERPSVASFHFGLPGEAAIRALRSAGIRLLATATSLPEARIIEGAGVDAIVAQGWEAGGHRGIFDPDGPDDRTTTADLTRQLVSEIDLPVISAGGIMDGAGIAAALDQGAIAAQLGTAFIACDESLADSGFRAALADAGPRDTTMTRAISGRPARVISNRFSALGAGLDVHEIPLYPIAYHLGKALHTSAQLRGEFGFGAHWMGEGASYSRPMSTTRLIAVLSAELCAACNSIPE